MVSCIQFFLFDCCRWKKGILREFIIERKLWNNSSDLILSLTLCYKRVLSETNNVEFLILNFVEKAKVFELSSTLKWFNSKLLNGSKFLNRSAFCCNDYSWCGIILNRFKFLVKGMVYQRLFHRNLNEVVWKFINCDQKKSSQQLIQPAY